MIYLDHNATAPIYKEAKKIMIDIADLPLNASAIHSFGRRARSILDNSRDNILKLLCLDDTPSTYEVTFTSSSTEANNLVANNYLNGEIFMSSIEHASLYNSNYQNNIRMIRVGHDGIIDLMHLEELLRKSLNKKKLVSVMLANNETGIIQPMKEICSLATKYNAEIHSDFTQGPGKMYLDNLGNMVDYISISGHKFGGPAGIGALIVKNKYNLKPIIIGGGQEKSLRAGTENIIGIAGMSKAAEITMLNLKKAIEHMVYLRNYMEEYLQNKFNKLRIVGKNSARIANTSMLINPEKDSQLQVIAFDLKGFAISSGSACSSGKVYKSRVLESMGYNEQDLISAIRISIGSKTTENEINQFLKTYIEING